MDEMIKLPAAFAGKMEQLLAGEYDAFLASYGQERYYGLRRNPLKDSAETFAARIPFDLEKVSWAAEGYYYRALQQPGRHVLHEAGAYYIQEPSAMAVAEILDPQPGERILDLCAAPGGKSTQIAGRMDGRGLLVANEVVPERAKVLSQNVERMGIANCVVCQEKPEHMAVLFPAFFDRILVDAPCSGEGMFRKDEVARLEWSPEQVEVCAQRQEGILHEAAKMLKPGGVLVYSTCTFSPEENERTVSRFVRAHDDFIIEETDCGSVFSAGRAEWIEDPAEGIHNTLRLWPHLLKGEGHYIARLRRRGKPVEGAAFGAKTDSAAQMRTAQTGSRKGKKGGRERETLGRDRELREEAEAFLKEEAGICAKWFERQGGPVTQFGDQLYLVPEEMIPLKGVRVLRPGLQLLTAKKNRFEPAHALALSLRREEAGRVRELSLEEAGRYLRGESLSSGAEKGWILLTCEGYPLGFGKASGGQIKNHYPKGLRKSI